MEWVLDNWVWIVLGGGMIAMHMFGHGGHGGHGGQDGHGGHAGRKDRTPEAGPDGEPGPGAGEAGTRADRRPGPNDVERRQR